MNSTRRLPLAKLLRLREMAERAGNTAATKLLDKLISERMADK